MDILSRPYLVADERIAYGVDVCQFGDLWLPEGDGRFPLVVFFHGGWWKSKRDLGYAGYLCEALKRTGIAAWSVEYRRVGETGGAWPHTFLDVATGFDFVTELARKYPLDLSRVIAMGHSAGGHLAFWVAGRNRVPRESEVFKPVTGPALQGVIGLAGAVDLAMTVEMAEGVFAHDRDEVCNLMGGAPEDVPKRYRAGDPGALLPLGVKQVLVQGTADDQIPAALPVRWAEKSPGAEVVMLADVDHLDVVDPDGEAWGVVLAHVKVLLGL